jgi:hypothetical protein
MNHILVVDAMGTVKARPFPTREAAERMAQQMNTLDATYYALLLRNTKVLCHFA